MIDLSNIKSVVETNHVEELNAYLKAGWIILNTAGGQWADSKEPSIKYSLGWDKDTEPVKPRLW